MAQPRKTQDLYFRLAKEEGYAARSAYKLKEIQDRRRVIHKGDRVLDLGCSPGSWVQVASELVGPKGRVVGIDLKPVTMGQTAHPNVKTVVADAFETEASVLLELLNGEVAPEHLRPFDVVLSDMAPSTEGGGGGTTDHFRSIELCQRVLELLPSLLKQGGHCVMKVFEGEAYPELLREAGRRFADAKGYKPRSSREVSREMFVIGLRYKGSARNANSQPPIADAIAPPKPKPLPGWGDASDARVRNPAGASDRGAGAGGET